MNSSKSKAKQLLSGFVGVAMAFSFVVGGAVAPASAATVEELTAQINSLLSTIAALQSQLSSISGGTTGGSSSSYVFNTDLTIGSKGADVSALQQILVSKGYLVMPAGVAMGYFGSLTQSAVSKWQAASGISPTAGYFGPKSRAAMNAMSGTGGTTTGGTVNPPPGSSLAVSAGTQPAPQLAPPSASRVPFTRVTLTAGSSDVTVNSVTVTRVGPASDVNFAGVVLLDENGIQIGTAKTLNSNHQATLGEAFTVKAGTSRTLTVGGNMAAVATLTNHAGEVPAFQIDAVSTNVPVVGALPIVGTGQVINATLSLGTATLYISSFDPNSASTQNIGTTGYRFAGIRVLAGSNEDIKVHSIRWNQSGSASASDLTNVVTVVDGVQYPSVLSADGKYYTTTFGSGIVLAKGFSKDIYVQGDLVGSVSANRTVQFDIYKTTDIYVSGLTYGYGITPDEGGGTASAATTATQFITSDGTTSGTASTPWFSGSTITINAGTVTTVTNATSIPAQNIAVNVPNQPLGGFTTDIKGESISVQQMVFQFNYASTDATNALLTSVSLVDENGAVVAGPVDAADVAATNQKVTFTDTVTLPTGKRTFTLKGKIDVDATNGDTITASTTPSSEWTTVTGQTTGNSVSLSGIGLLTMNPMTIRTAALAVSASANPAAQTVIAGTVGHLFANFQFDASQSGEDVRFSSLPMTLTSSVNDDENKISGCQLYDGATALNTGSNVINPTVANAGAETFTLDSALVIPKGMVKTVGLKCNISSAATGNFDWDIAAANVTTINTNDNVVGVTSSQAVTVTGSADGALMSTGTASLAVSTDSSSPGYTIASAGASSVTLGVAKFRATNDSINLQRIGLRISNTASSSAADLISVTLWDGATQVGTAVFTGTSVLATSTLTTIVNISKDADKAITIKGDLSAIGTSQPVTVSGHLLAVNVESNTNTYGTGVGSGSTINSTGSTAVSGVRIFKSYPTLASGTGLGSSGVADGRLLRFTVTAGSAGPVGLGKFAITLATSSASVTNLNAFAYTDSSYSQPVSGVNTGGQLMTNNYSTLTSAPTVAFYPQTTAGATTTIQVPAGATRFFEVRGTVTAASGATSYSVTATLGGDSAYPAQAGGLTSTSTTLAWVDGGGAQYSSNRAFLWSPNSTTTSSTDDVDWTNGYGLPGLPASGIIQTRSN